MVLLVIFVIGVFSWITIPFGLLSDLPYKIRRLIISIYILLTFIPGVLLLSARLSKPCEITNSIIDYNRANVSISSDGILIYYADIDNDNRTDKILFNSIKIDTRNYIELYVKYYRPPGIFKYTVSKNDLKSYKGSMLHLTWEEYNLLYTYKHKY